MEDFQAKEKTKEEAEKKAAEEAQKAKDKTAAEKTVTSFMEAYKARNETQMKSYLTEAAKNEHTSTDLLHSSFEVISYRITETTSTAADKFKILIRETDQYSGDPSTYIIKKQFEVVKISDKWLIDSWDIIY